MDQWTLQKWTYDWFRISRRCSRLFDLAMRNGGDGSLWLQKYGPIMKTDIRYCHHKDFLCIYREAERVDSLMWEKQLPILYYERQLLCIPIYWHIPDDTIDEDIVNKRFKPARPDDREPFIVKLKNANFKLR